MWQGESRLLTTAQEFDALRVFHHTEPRVTVPLNVNLVGDVVIDVFHARRMVGKMVAVKVSEGGHKCSYWSLRVPRQYYMYHDPSLEKCNDVLARHVS